MEGLGFLRRWFGGLSTMGKAIVVIVIVVAALAVIGSLSRTPTSTGGGGNGTGGNGGTSSRCDTASTALVDAIESGLTVTGGGSLSNAQIVKSDDYENAYFVAARIEGEGMADAVGVWSTNDPAGGGSIFAADSFARQFSDWGPGPGFLSSDDGFAEVRECAAG